MPLPAIDPSQYETQLAGKIARYKEDFAEFDLPSPAMHHSAPLHYRLRAEFRIWHQHCASEYSPGGRKVVLSSMLRLALSPWSR